MHDGSPNPSQLTTTFHQWNPGIQTCPEKPPAMEFPCEISKWKHGSISRQSGLDSTLHDGTLHNCEFTEVVFCRTYSTNCSWAIRRTNPLRLVLFCCVVFIYEWRTKLLVWGVCHHQKWVVPYRLLRFRGLQHQHRSRTIQFTLWHHEICTCSGKCTYGFAPCSSSAVLL